MYPGIVFAALRIEFRDVESRLVKKKAVYVVIGVSSDAVAKLLASGLATNRSQAPRAQGFGSE